jgi:hypothetical protein
MLPMTDSFADCPQGKVATVFGFTPVSGKTGKDLLRFNRHGLG